MLRTNYEVMFCKSRKTFKKLLPLKNFLNLKKILKYRYYIYLHNIHDLSFRPYVKVFLETLKIFLFAKTRLERINWRTIFKVTLYLCMQETTFLSTFIQKIFKWHKAARTLHWRKMDYCMLLSSYRILFRKFP